MEDDDDLWGPPQLAVKDDTLRKQTLRGYEFWFDCRTDVLEENFQNQWYCEQVWLILNEKKKKLDVEIVELDKDSALLQDDMASCGSGDSLDIASSVRQDKTLVAVLPDADTSSAKSALDEDENTSSISDAQTTETKDSTNHHTEETDRETRVTPHKIAANDTVTVEVAEDANTSSSPVLAIKIEEDEEHSCSSLVTDQVFDPIKQVPNNKSPSAISRENIGGSTLMPLVSETREKVREKANATNEDGEILKDHQQINSLQDIVTASEPFTTESLLEMCDEPDRVRETSIDERIKRPHPEAVKTVVKDELIINLLAEATKKAGSNALLSPGSVLIKKRQGKSNSSNSKGISTSFIRNTKQKVQGEAGKIFPVKNSTQTTPTQHSDSTLALIERIRKRGVDGQIMSDSVTSISELNNKTGKELRSIAKELKITHYYKLKKEDVLQQVIKQLKLTDCTNQRMEI